MTHAFLYQIITPLEPESERRNKSMVLEIEVHDLLGSGIGYIRNIGFFAVGIPVSEVKIESVESPAETGAELLGDGLIPFQRSLQDRNARTGPPDIQRDFPAEAEVDR